MPRSALALDERKHLSVAFAVDTLTAVGSCSLVDELVIASPNARLAEFADQQEAIFVKTPSHEPLNTAVTPSVLEVLATRLQLLVHNLSGKYT